MVGAAAVAKGEPGGGGAVLISGMPNFRSRANGLLLVFVERRGRVLRHSDPCRFIVQYVRCRD